MNLPFKYGTGGKLGFLWPASHSSVGWSLRREAKCGALVHMKDKSDDVVKVDAASDNVSYRAAN
jgi:hypothetical protein